jgi:TolB-like protein
LKKYSEEIIFSLSQSEKLFVVNRRKKIRALICP